jgi:hypothetical protein
MAEALDGVWIHLDRIVQNARRTIQQPKGRVLSVSGPTAFRPLLTHDAYRR